MKYRRVYFYADHFKTYFLSLPEDVQNKIKQVILFVEECDPIPQKYFKHIQGVAGLYEIRIEFKSNIYRIFCFFDEGKLIITANGFQKKDQKTPPEEIERAIKIKKEYEESKR